MALSSLLFKCLKNVPLVHMNRKLQFKVVVFPRLPDVRVLGNNMSFDPKQSKTFAQLIVKCSPEIAKKFFYQAIDLFCGQSGPQQRDYSDIWTLFEWWDIIDSSQQFLKTYQSTENKLSELLADLSPEYHQIISDCLEVRSTDLKHALLERTNEINHAVLRDYDWKLKMTLASDQMAQIDEPRLALDLDLQQEDGSCKMLSLDMSKDEVKKMIDALEAATKIPSE